MSITRRRISTLLMDLGASVLPRCRSEWLQAMRAELSHVPDAEALRFAIGCCVTCCSERLRAVAKGRPAASPVPIRRATALGANMAIVRYEHNGCRGELELTADSVAQGMRRLAELLRDPPAPRTSSGVTDASASASDPADADAHRTDAQAGAAERLASTPCAPLHLQGEPAVEAERSTWWPAGAGLAAASLLLGVFLGVAFGPRFFQ